MELIQAIETPQYVPEMPEAVKSHVSDCYAAFIRILKDKLSYIDDKIVRKRLKTLEDDNITLAQLRLGARFFEPRVTMSLKVQPHIMGTGCECYICSNRTDNKKRKLDLMYIFAINVEYDFVDLHLAYMNMYEEFELTRFSFRVVDRLTDEEMIDLIMSFFNRYYPFTRCANCYAEFARAPSQFCHACGALALKYNIDGNKCCICYDTDVEMVCCKLKCKHVMHEVCYKKHKLNSLKTSNVVKCPLCKAEVTEYSRY